MKELRRRFAADYKIPISIYDDPDLWDYLIGIYGKEDLWNKLLEDIKNWPSPEEFIKKFYETRDNIIKSLNLKEGVKNLNKADLSKYKVDSNVRSSDIYNEAFVGKTYISLDLKKANFQALRHFDPDIFDNIDNYEDWIRGFTGKDSLMSWYFPESKYIRQVIFGNLNPKRQITIEKYLIQSAYNLVDQENNLVMLGSDEAIIEDIPELNLEELEKKIKQSLGIDVKVERYTLREYKFSTTNNHTIPVFAKVLGNGEIKYKGIPKHYYPQIFEILHGIEPDPKERDLMFYMENEPAKFLNRLRLVE